MDGEDAMGGMEVANLGELFNETEGDYSKRKKNVVIARNNEAIPVMRLLRCRSQ